MFKSLKPAKKKITIAHLLNQTCGLEWKGFREHENWLSSKDPIYFVLNKELVETPGETYNYNSGTTHLLSVILSKASGVSTLNFAKNHLFNDLQIENVEWVKRNKGYHDGSGLGLSLLPQDLIKIGELLLKDGSFNNKQLLSKRWIDILFDEKHKSKTRWGIRGSKHGYCWYKATLNDIEINYGMGYGGQFIFIIPDKELVIVATHNHDTPNGLRQQSNFIKNKLPELLDNHK